MARVREMYRAILDETPFLVMAGEDAVLSKLGANLFLATKISFANELAHAVRGVRRRHHLGRRGDRP